MPATTRTRVKICCIADPEEARMAIRAGADAVGLVSAMPSGPGVISEEAIATILPRVPPPVATFLLTSLTDVDALVEQHRRLPATALQLVDRLAPAALDELGRRLPGVRRVQVVHVTGEASVAEAEALAGRVEAVLLDSGDPTAAVKELGGTGRVHDWRWSRRIREALEEKGTPVFLAGGLGPENVAEAIRTVRPFGVDLCSGVRTAGRLDRERLAAFMGAVRGAR